MSTTHTGLPGSSLRGARLREIEADLSELHDSIHELTEGKLSDQPSAALAVRAAKREAEALEAEYQRLLEGLAGGSTGPALSRGQSMREAVGQGGPDVTLAQLVRGLGLGDWRGVPGDVRAEILSTTGPTSSVPGYVSAGIIDLAREQSVVFRAGAQLMPIEAPSAKVARLVSEPSVEWEPESASRDLTDGAWTFDSAELTAYSAWLYTTFSVEAAEDVIDLEQTLRTSFAAQLALAFDQAGLTGDGADMPVGLTNMGTAEDRIIEVNDVGPLTNFTPFVRAAGAVRAKHHEPRSVILTPGLWTEINCLQDGDFNPLQAPRAYTQLEELVSGVLPEDGGLGGDEHTAIVGDLSGMTFGVRTNLMLEASRLGAGFKKGSVELRAYARFGMYLTQPDAIAVMRAITVAEES